MNVPVAEMRPRSVACFVLLVSLSGAFHPPLAAQRGDSLGELETLARQKYAEDDLEGARSLYLTLIDRHESPTDQARLTVTLAWLEYLVGGEEEAASRLAEALALDFDLRFRPELYSQEFVEIYSTRRREVKGEHARRANRLIRQGVEVMQEGGYDTARRLMEEALEIVPDHPPGLYNLALLDLRQGDRDQALTRFQRLLALDQAGQSGDSRLEPKRKAEVLHNLGLIYYAKGFYEDANRVLSEAIALDPANGKAWSNLGLVFRQLGRPAAAIDAFERARRLDPDDATVLSNLALAHMDARLWTEAAELLLQASRQQPESPAVWLNLGLVRRAQGDLARAREALLQVPELDSENRLGLATRALSFLSLVSYESHDYPGSVRQAQRAIGLDSEDVNAWTYLGLSQRQLGELKAARQSLEQALRLDPTQAETTNTLGSVYFSLGELDLAAQTFRQALAMRPDLTTAQRNLELTRQRLAEGRSSNEPAQTPLRDTASFDPPAKTADGKAESSVPRSNPRGPRKRGRKKPAAPVSVEPTKLGMTFVTQRHARSGTQAVRIETVTPDGVSSRAGLEAGDLILRVDGRATGSATELQDHILRQPPGSIVVLDLVRDEKPLRVHLAIE